MEYILKCVNHYYGLSINELRELAYQLANKLRLQYPSSWNDELKADNVETFFKNLAGFLDEHQFNTQTIFNMDESGFSTVPSKIGKVIALKGMRRVGKIETAERGTMVTMALTVCSNGTSIAPFFLFPRKNMQSVFLDGTPNGTTGFANDSGWMCQPEFVRYIRHFIRCVRPTKERPVLLLMDNHTSHLSVEALDTAAANGVHILSFPPHCSHRLQPLDVSVFGVLLLSMLRMLVVKKR